MTEPRKFFKTVVNPTTGKMETVEVDQDLEAAGRAALARAHRELRDMIEGNVQFFDDPLAKPPEAPTSAPGALYEDEWPLDVHRAFEARLSDWMKPHDAKFVSFAMFKWGHDRWIYRAVAEVTSFSQGQPDVFIGVFANPAVLDPDTVFIVLTKSTTAIWHLGPHEPHSDHLRMLP